MAEQSLIVRSLSLREGEFNWVFLIWYLVSAILSIFFLFYFNRFFASLVTYGARAYLWHYYRVHVHAQALQVSLLAGRVFFKNVRYHGQNETILIHDGYITWRYWLRHVQELECRKSPTSQRTVPKDDPSSNDDATRTSAKGVEAGRERKSRHLPCRVLVKARGIEWFIYNRSPAYDAVFRSMRERESLPHTNKDPAPLENSQLVYQSSHSVSEKAKGDPRSETEEDEKCFDTIGGEKLDSISTDSSSLDIDPASTSLPGLLDLLPIAVEGSKGAIVLGNRSTRSIVTAKFESAVGKIDARESRPVDQYKQTFDFEFVHPIIEFKHNRDYVEHQVSEGAKLHSHSESTLDDGPKSRYFERFIYRSRVRQALDHLRSFAPFRRGSVESFNHPRSKSTGARNLAGDNAGEYGQSRWLGLRRYLDDDDDVLEQERWKAVEYGQFPTICDSPSISMSFHWDVPGLVRESSNCGRKALPGSETDINGEPPPDWGIELKIGGGIIHYGPWADRQRSDIQSVFFPTLYKDSSPSAKLAPGQRRVSTVLEIVLVIEESTTLRVPTREESKDWRWREHKVPSDAPDVKNKKTKHHGKAGKSKKPTQSPEVRSPGWLDIKVLPDSTVRFSMDLLARDNGYRNRVDLDLKGLELSSSINHGLLLRSKSQTISCDLSNPLAWNSLRRWHVDIHDNETELFILRDHIFLVTDLISDWSSGPPGSFHTFIPFEYTIGLHLTDFKLYLNANDSNIINNPSDLEDNTFVIVHGKKLKANMAIPLKTFRPTRSKVAFDVDASEGGLLLHTPPWNTQHTFLKSPKLASLRNLNVKGSYSYFTTTSPYLTDILLMDADGLSPRINLYGFLIRYFMKIKDNYFGDDIHFRTLEEYKAQVSKQADQGLEDAPSVQHHRISNDLDVILGITVDNLCLILPARLYSTDENVRLEVLSVTSDLRITNYYMDCMVSSSPIALSYTNHAEDDQHETETYSSTQLFIDGLQIFGHRLFGLPPTEPTYVCNWDFDVGSVSGEVSVEFVRYLAISLRCFGLTFDDAENALPPIHPTLVHDVTFLRLRIQPLSICIRMERAGLMLGTGKLEVDFNDWAGALFSDRLRVLVHDLTLAVIDTHRASTGRDDLQSTTNTHAYLRTTIEIHRVNRKPDFKADRQLQQSHITLHDGRTNRVPWLVHNHDPYGVADVAAQLSKAKPPAMPFPLMPEPISINNLAAVGGASSISTLAKSESSTSISTGRSSFLMDAPSNRDKVKTKNGLKGGRPCQRQTGRLDGSTGTEAFEAPKASTKNVMSSLMTEDLSVQGSSRERAASVIDGLRSGLSFSSPYKKPHFPLLAAKPETSELPCLPGHLASERLANSFDGLESIRTQITDRDTERSSFMVDLRQGFQAFCNPEALFLMTEMFAALQTDDTVALLDKLQVDTMTEILSTKKTRVEDNQITDVRIFVPYVAVRFVNSNKAKPLSTDIQDRYDINLDHLTATASLSTRLSKPSAPPHPLQFSVHLSTSKADCSARQLVGGLGDDQAIISLSVIDPVFWMLYGATAAAEMQFEKLEVVSAGRKVDYVSSLIRETLIVFEDLAARFISLEKERKSRIQFLVFLLTMEGDDRPDPPFLTRASYVLRSASHHIRSSDSWRLMSRLRHTYQCLPERSRNSIQDQCTQEPGSCPQHAGQLVVLSLQRWQTLESTQLKHNALLQRVYGELFGSSAQEPDVLVPFKATMRAGIIRVLVKPGRKQNEIAVQGLVVGLATNQPPSSDSAPPHDTSNTTESTVQVHCVEIAVRLNWTMLELIENLIETLQTTTNLRSQITRASTQSQAVSGHLRRHIVVSSEMIVLNCDTLNLKIVSLCHGLQTSIVMLKDEQDQSMSFVINADVATSELKTHSAMLTLYKLRYPRIFGSRDGSANKDTGEMWRLDGAGQDVFFQVFANPLQLIEAADCFLEQEVAHINNWTRSFPLAQTSAPPSRDSSKQIGLPQVQISLSLETYLLSVGILPSLVYQISGTQGHSSVKSGLRGERNLAFGFGLNEHLHTFKTKRHDGEDPNVLSALRMPPISGRLLIDLCPSKRSIDFQGLVENVVFDASAVHAIFSAVNRPEIMSLGASLRNDLSIFRGHYEDIFKTMVADQKFQSSEPPLYSAHIDLASLAITARTLESSFPNRGAELQFQLSRVQLRATNKVAGAATAMAFPEVELQCRGIDLSLLRFDDSDVLRCGNVAIQAMLRSTSKPNDAGRCVRSHQIRSSSLQVNVYPETGPVIVAILAHLQDTLKNIDFSQEVHNLKKLRRTRLKRNASSVQAVKTQIRGETGAAVLFNAMYSLEMMDICVIWRIENAIPISPGREPENLILSFTKIDLATRKDNAARLLIENLQLQTVPVSQNSTVRSLNSALLPEVLFNVAYVSTGQDRRLAFQVAGKSLDLQLTSQFILPANDLRRSIALSIQQVRTATADWTASAPRTDGQSRRLTGNKKLASLLIDADFAGAVVYMQGRSVIDLHTLALNNLRGGRLPQHGRYNQFTPENATNSSTTLRSPGIAFKVEYKNAGSEGQSLNAETKVDASSNILYPTVVPLIMEVSSTVRDIVGEPNEQEKSTTSSVPQPSFFEDERLRGADPAAIFGNCRLNLGLRICRQEFSLSCQPIARVAATARFDDIYITVNTTQSQEHGKFFTVSGACTRPQASIQHVYSRESTGSFEVDSIIISLMNSKHISAANGISAIMNVSPMKAQINGKQLQDFLLFREIWVPPEIRQSTPAAVPVPASEPQAFIVQRYQQIAATGAFPWNATVSIAKLDVQVDLGQSLGKSAFVISKLWISSKKKSDWEQNLCLGFDRMAVDSTGRMSGFVELKDLKVRTSIQWPVIEQAHNQTPLVQASLAFNHLRVKAAFDYQAFAIADITLFEFLMYNVRDLQNPGCDRLVGVLEGDKIQAFCTTTSASQAIALYQAFQKLGQEKLAAYQASLRDTEKFLRRKSSVNTSSMRAAVKRQNDTNADIIGSSLKLQTDVVVKLKAVKVGSFPSTFFDNQVFKLEALDASARFAVVLENAIVHSSLGMTLGQLRIALSGITRASVPKTLGEVSVADVVSSATGSRGGTILKVPKLVATMETWQSPESMNVDYIFKSSFQGRVDVGWNYSRISYIRGMWARHARTLAQRLGKPLPQSAVQITGGPRPEGDDGNQTYAENEEGKITAVVNVPQSKYSYTALQPPVIETPQLRDMGEATPPLEWIGLHRERLPNLTHQIVIVTLLEVAKEVDDAYSKILGSS